MKLSGKCVLLGLTTVLWIICPIRISISQEASMNVYENSVIKERDGETLIFVTNEEKRILALKGCLSNKTRIMDETGQELTANDLTPGSLWMIEMQCSIQEENLPLILQLRRIDNKSLE
jgi:hypothetical protein